MKAVEYAQQYIKEDDKQKALANVANQFVKEFGFIATARNIDLPESLITLVKDFDRKWVKFVELIEDEGIAKNGFRRMLKETAGELYGILIEAGMEEK